MNARHHLSPPERHPRRAGARPSTCRRWCSATWARLRHRRRLHARSLDRRERFYGEFLVNAQGEDVVAGIRTPQYADRGRARGGSDKPSMEEAMPRSSRELAACSEARAHYRDMQDIEFTVEQGKLWMLQTRNGKRTAKAALKHRRRHGQRGADHEGGSGAARRRRRARPAAAPDHRPEGPSATWSPRACRPRPARPRADRVRRRRGRAAKAKARRKVILVRIETSPEDIHGMHAAKASSPRAAA
jgi:pyruvate,orthophosphate dikinase